MWQGLNVLLVFLDNSIYKSENMTILRARRKSGQWCSL